MIRNFFGMFSPKKCSSVFRTSYKVYTNCETMSNELCFVVMYYTIESDKIIFRKKQKNDSIGKNPFIYYPISPLNLLKKYTNEIEEKLTKIANLSNTKYNDYKTNRVKIKIFEKEELS